MSRAAHAFAGIYLYYNTAAFCLVVTGGAVRSLVQISSVPRAARQRTGWKKVSHLPQAPPPPSMPEKRKIVAELADTTREISTLDIANSLNDMVQDIDRTYKLAITVETKEWKPEEWDDITKVAAMLEKIVDGYCEKKPDKKPDDEVQQALAAAIAQQNGRRTNDNDLCDLCGIRHPDAGDKTKCQEVPAENNRSRAMRLVDSKTDSMNSNQSPNHMRPLRKNVGAAKVGQRDELRSKTRRYVHIRILVDAKVGRYSTPA